MLEGVYSSLGLFLSNLSVSFLRNLLSSDRGRKTSPSIRLSIDFKLYWVSPSLPNFSKSRLESIGFLSLARNANDDGCLYR